ncbi:phosphoribosyltransferase family protein [Methanocalculus sp. MSAO_Arc2]|uniref:phosphoribosyltransferase family protein n=1 Tax=Methanocalculus sp. MSAO_Arc2 TaxID=2293855 RepID=UPI002689F870
MMLKDLVERIKRDASVDEDGLIQMQGFIHHLADTNLLQNCGCALAEIFRHYQPTKILTAEVSGILAALPAGIELDIPVLIARKELPKTMQGLEIHEKARSRTKGTETSLFILTEHIREHDRILIIDDVLARGETASALIRLARRSGAAVVGVGVLVEKRYEAGRARIEPEIPVHALCTIISVEDGVIRFADDM